MRGPLEEEEEEGSFSFSFSFSFSLSDGASVRGDSFSFGICKGGDQRVPKFRLLCGCGGDPEECLAVCQQNSKLKSTNIDNIDNVLGNIEDILFDYVFDSFWGLVP